MNFIHIAGHLGADPETRFTSTGKKVTTLRIATNSRKGKEDVTIWWRVTLWGEEFDKLIPHLKKGSAVMVFGEVQKPEIFTDKEGKSQISLEISASEVRFSPFGGKPSGQQAGIAGPAAASMGAPSAAAPNPYMGSPMGMSAQGQTYDDEVPF